MILGDEMSLETLITMSPTVFEKTILKGTLKVLLFPLSNFEISYAVYRLSKVAMDSNLGRSYNFLYLTRWPDSFAKIQKFWSISE